jgi:SAM-dependent methyltransferase
VSTSTAPDTPSGDELELGTSLKDLILRALGTEYTSVSGVDSVATGNHYQSVALGDINTSGFREDRARFLNQIDFRGKKVLDLGSNLGEITRAARARGAYLADGFETDSYFLEISELINAFTGVTRVSFFQRDIADPASYDEPYDMVLAFSVFHYVGRALARVAQITDVFVLETHKLDGNFDLGYLEPVSSYFPHYRVLGESDWGTEDGMGDEIRAVVVFAKNEQSLAGALRRVEPKALAKGASAASYEGYVDPQRTRLQDTFFSVFDFDTTEELIETVESMRVDVDLLSRSKDCRVAGYNGWVYWFLFLKGYCEYRRTGKIEPGNVYYDYIVQHHKKDPGVAQEILEPEAAAQYLRRQFHDMDLCREAGAEGDVSAQIAPVRILLAQGNPKNAPRIFEPDSDNQLVARGLDGWHRLFAAKIFGVNRMRSAVIEQRDTPRIYGAVEDLEQGDGHLSIRGWCFDPHQVIHSIEVRDQDQNSISVGGIHHRLDVRADFPQLPLSRYSGFEVDCEYAPNARAEVTSFELTALSDWVPIGEMTAYHSDGMFDVGPWPPEEVASRLLEMTGPRRLAIWAVTSLFEILGVVSRYRASRYFDSALLVGSDTGLLQPYMPRLLRAAVTELEWDEEVIEWRSSIDRAGAFVPVEVAPPTELGDESFDLALAHPTLTRLTREQQQDWLDEIFRLLRPGGYAALTVNGELQRRYLGDEKLLRELETDGISDRLLGNADVPGVRPRTYQTRDYTMRICDRLFDVITYGEGLVCNHDLIVLRRP